MSRTPIYTPASTLIMWLCGLGLVACLALARCSAPVEAAVSAAPRVTVPPASARYRIALEREVGAHFGIEAPVARIAAQIHQESHWQPSAASPFAEGLAQFTPATAAWLPDVCPDVGAPDTWDPAWSLRAIACYDAWLYARASGASECDRWAFTLSAYNGGEVALRRERSRASATGADAARWFNSVERFSARAGWAHTENRNYVRRILTSLEPAYLSAGWPGTAVCT